MSLVNLFFASLKVVCLGILKPGRMTACFDERVLLKTYLFRQILSPKDTQQVCNWASVFFCFRGCGI